MTEMVKVEENEERRRGEDEEILVITHKHAYTQARRKIV